MLKLAVLGAKRSKTRATTKLKHKEAKSGQAEIFQSLHDMGPDELTAFQETERQAAEQTLLKLTPEVPESIRYDKLWPQVLARHIVRHSDINQISARLRRDGKLIFPDWETRKRVPQPHYRIQRA